MDMRQMVDEKQACTAREADLSEVLALYAEPRAVSYGFVIGFVLLGLLGSVLVALAGARVKRSRPLRFETNVTSSFERGVAAYKRGEWDEALRAMRQAERAVHPSYAARAPEGALRPPPPRVADYIERLSLVHRDGERLTRAEQALDADEPERALVLAALVAPNSPLFAQAEGLGRKARARIAADLRSEPPVRAEVSEEPVVVDPEPEPQASEGRPKPRIRRRAPPKKPEEPSYEGEW